MKKISYLLTVVLALAVAACDNTPRELTELMLTNPICSIPTAARTAMKRRNF